MFCEKCGYKLPENSFYCEKCGAKINLNNMSVQLYSQKESQTNYRAKHSFYKNNINPVNVAGKGISKKTTMLIAIPLIACIVIGGIVGIAILIQQNSSLEGKLCAHVWRDDGASRTRTFTFNKDGTFSYILYDKDSDKEKEDYGVWSITENELNIRYDDKKSATTYILASNINDNEVENRLMSLDSHMWYVSDKYFMLTGQEIVNLSTTYAVYSVAD